MCKMKGRRKPSILLKCKSLDSIGRLASNEIVKKKKNEIVKKKKEKRK